MRQLQIVEVGPRDGFQVIKPFIPTETKIDICRRLAAAGLRRLEIGAFVSPAAIPQMQDIREVLAALRADGEGPELSALVPNRRGAEDALKVGMDALVYVVSASESHNRNNVRRSVAESMDEMLGCLKELQPKGRFRFNLATAFHCPFEGPTAHAPVLAMIEQVLGVRSNAEIALCDTTGYASPQEISALVTGVRARFGTAVSLAYHAHDTYGFGLSGVMAAWDAGVDIFDTAVAGLGGCPFAPGATGNTATEDITYAFERRGIATGIDMQLLLAVADNAAGLPGAQVGGHIRAVAAGKAASANLWRDPVLVL
ncbi:MAG: hydroxymethylglutaryl-CoA lyase [Beijerinckiaceae bacterium]